MATTGIKRKLPGDPAAAAIANSAPPAITVVVKIRPPNARELDLAKNSKNNDLDFYTLSDDSQAVTFDNTAAPNNPSWSRFDQVYDKESNQEQLFEGTALPIVSACLQGYNGLILAYGQTGSGKTFSMTGPKDALTDPSRHHLQGIIPRALEQVFSTIADSPAMF